MNIRTGTKSGTWPGRNTNRSVSSASPGCFVRGTEIRLPEARASRIEDLVPGLSTVLRADGAAVRTVTGRAGPETPPVFFVTASSGDVLGVTEHHPMVVRRRGAIVVVAARDLALGDLLLRLAPDDERPVTTRVARIERRIVGDLVYNFEVEGSADVDSHLVVASNLVTGDLALQAEIERRLALPRPSREIFRIAA